METILTQQTPLAGRINRRLLPAVLLALLCLGGSSAFAQTLLTEGFESSTFPPTNWTRVIQSGSTNWTQASNPGGVVPSGIPTHGGSKMAYYYCWGAPSGYKADLVTPSIDFSTTAGLKQVSFWYYKNVYSYGTQSDNMTVHVNTSPTSTGSTLIGTFNNYYTQSPATPTAGWYKYTVTIPASYNGTTNYIIFRANSNYGPDIFLDDVTVYNLTNCTGPVAAGAVIPAGTTTVCPGTTVNLQDTGYGLAGLTLQNWQYSTNGGTTWLNIPGATSDFYTTFPITASTKFRFYNTCTQTLDTSWSNAVTINVSGGGAFPKYAALPFFEDFESWSNGCSTTDIPSIYWTNSPSTGNSSWRRDDQGASASWTAATSGGYNPAFYKTAHSARFHSYYAVGASAKGVLNCYVDCSATTGTKELEFYLRTDAGPSYPKDSMVVDYSTDAGMTWTNLRKLGPGTGGWDFFGNINLPSNSATTIVRFTASQNYGYTGYTDIYLDAVRIMPPCGAKPTAGTIDSVTACPNKNFKLSLTGTSAAAGLSYLWQYKPTGSTLGWSNLPGGNVPKPTANISVPTSFRVIVTCNNTTPAVSDTSLVYNVKLDPFYYCYCDIPSGWQYGPSYAQYMYNGIGNVSVATRPAGVVLMSNTTGLNYPYSSYARTVAPPMLIRDSTYRFSMTDIQGSYSYTSSVPGAFFLDWNRNGVWDLPGERIMNKSTSTSSGQILFQDYQIPSTASVGLTGLRAVHAYGMTNPVDPCGVYYYNGETEDYLVYIEYQPCNGPVNAGTSFISDSVICPGYYVDLWNTTYEKQRTGITRTWEVSTNNGASYTAIPNSTNKDTMFNVQVTASSYGLRYRLRVICGSTGDTTYSNWLGVTNPDPNSCYPFASALPPGTADSSDIGSFVIGPYVNPQPMVVSGPHLSNPAATRRRTDYTKVGPMTLAADTTYRIAIYHTMRSITHSDALASVFIDFNHDGKYTEASPGYPYPSELIYRGKTDAINFYLDTFFTMPSTLIPGATGMRVILNNDVNPSNPGNYNATGGFASGEVEDYVVTLTRTNVGVGGVNLIQNLAVFPNPTSAKATVVFDAPTAVSHLEMTVTTIAGQRVMSQSFDNVGRHFSAQVDLTGKAKGVYFVELRADDGQKVSRKLIVQ